MKPVIFAIDPGTEESGYAIYDPNDQRVIDCGVLHNPMLLNFVKAKAPGLRDGTRLAIEMVASYGMAVGREVFETCVWIGRFQQAWPAPDTVRLVFRQEVKLHLCGQTKAKDAHVRQAILDRYPRTGGGATKQVGTAKNPGPLFGMSSHAWPALGVAIVVDETPWKKKRRRITL